ncbi:hypothetical protein BX600DRAFT_531073 [Xylariales sp. PMI_506]|nr:hypothetical protein BX600DRAFT_531073 [Xylariales sp. PMI_506]
MASYLITGASRGMGFEFLRQLSDDPANTVIGLARNKEATENKIITELGQLANVSVAEVSTITSGSLDVVIANAAARSSLRALDPIGVLGGQAEELERELVESFKSNVVGNVHLFNLYIPLIMKGRVKKIVTISSGMADNKLTALHNISAQSPYAISKAAMNTAVAKFSAQYSKDGVLFFSICPGVVGTDRGIQPTPHQMQRLSELQSQFLAYAPRFTGPAKPDDAVEDMLSVIKTASLEEGYAGAFVSHLGKGKPWL